MSKNIVILCDGTSNEISQDRTNILRLFRCLKKSPEQSVFYDPGVGTFGAENAASYYYRRGVEIWGLATGWGLDANVKEAYRYLVHTYQHHSDDDDAIEADQIFIFGFSRGAYTARVLAGFIHAVGLLHPDNLNLLDYAYRAYKSIGENADSESSDSAFAEVRLFERILRPTRPKIRFLGLFDTVGSVIESGRYGPRLRSHAFTSTNPSVESIRHALALDERRTMFQPQLWPAGKPFRPERFNPKSEKEQDVKEVWFVGSHGDVGGGYPEAKSAIAKIPLAWMIDEARSAQLKLKTRTINTIVLGKNGGHYVGPNSEAPMNDSMTKGWSILEGLPRFKRSHIHTTRKTLAGVYVPWFEERIVPEGASLHSTVFEHDKGENAISRSNMPSVYVAV